jgi:hypothetical protein
MGEIVDRYGYKVPVLDCRRPKDFKTDKSFVAFVEREAEKICGAYLLKEQDAKNASLGSKRRLNLVFDLMGVAYEDRPVLEEAPAKQAGKSASGVGQLSKPPKKATGKRNTHEPDFVRVGRQLAKPVKRKSRKVSFALGKFTGESSSSE